MFFPPEIKNILIKGIDKDLTITKGSVGTQCYIASLFKEMERDVVVLMPDESHLKTFSTIFRLVTKKRASSFWEESLIELFPFNPSTQDKNNWAKRWASLLKLKEAPSPKVIVLTVDNLLPLWPPKDILDKYLYLISRGDEIFREDLLELLIKFGYERTNLTTSIGEFSVRGDVVDIYAPGYPMPLRIEFFGDIVESIRNFNPTTQRSINSKDDAFILPVSPIIGETSLIERAGDLWSYLWKSGLITKDTIFYFEENIKNREQYIPPGLFYPDATAIKDYFPKDSVFFLIEPENLRRSLEDVEGEWEKEFMDMESSHGVRIPYNKGFLSASQAKNLWIGEKKLIFDSLRREGNTISLPERTYHSFTDLFWRPEEKRRPLNTLVNYLKEWNRTKNQVVLLFRTDKSKNKFLSILRERFSSEDEDIKIYEDFDPHKKGIFVGVSPLTTGISLDWNFILFLPESILFPTKNKSLSLSSKKFKGLRDIDEIREGDFLVHKDYGIGKFVGLTRIQVNDIGNDYLEILYADSNKLYVPVDKLHLVQKYKGPDGIQPKLDRLGSNNWSKTRANVKKAIEAIAQDIVKMYAYRKVVKGFKYPPIDEDFREFEATFPFEETPDQEKAIEDVLKDMESDEPMDRLICGDVGFGKTEIAMRAAYRAVCAGRQVAVLCPTTVLAEQHFRNFRSRMENFGVNVAMLSRFVPRAMQKKIVEAIKRGEVDIVIGTHRLLSSDIEIPRLGLFILDEEQRFGVRQKEKLKEMRKKVDVLTLTATPIPRTLQLSLTGIRKLSVIETPPVDRKPVKTSIIERDKELLKEILSRELERGGQVFWVYNRVRGLGKIKDFIKSLLPHAKVGVAHGQMSEKILEETLHDFLLGDIQVLVCTAIIESGLDFPRANTLIVDTPQLFGLGQLYQLRGRVGRSSTQAYAYFLVNSIKDLSKSVINRLKTILELDYLGAGFKVAMADLKLRGAGNLLGEAQTGNIAKVGLDLYLEMLDKEIKKIKGEVVEDEIEPELNIFVEANIPSNYIKDNEERLYFYKFLSSCRTPDEFELVKEELKDRYGTLPGEILNLISILEFKSMLIKLAADRIDFYKDRILISWENTLIKLEPEKMLKWIEEHKTKVKFLNPKKIELALKGKEFSKELEYWLNSFNTLVEL